ncbi:hypothetical protein EDD86DRAFT_245827 [Gorgonomyces haynaldii]|nr:hypothetical protein EDD86DRAFT_245827 [Gorgonomyces haynaldii]
MSAANASVTNPAVSTMPVAPITIVVMAAGGLSLLLAIGLLVQHLVNRMPSKDIESPKVISEPEGHVLRYREQLLRLKPLDLPEEEIVFHLPPAPFSPPPFHHNNPALALPMKAVARLSFRDSVYLNMISNPSMSSLSDDDASSSVIHFEESRSHFIVY